MRAQRFDDLTRLLAASPTRRAALKALAGATLGSLAVRAGRLSTAAAQRPPTATTNTAATQLAVMNESAAEVHVYLTLSPVGGCAHSVTIAEVPFVTNRVNDNQGWFTLAPHGTGGDSVSYTAPANACLSGNFSFGAPPQNCPDRTQFPNGMNLAEFTLNNGGQGGGAQETLDISAVYGVNAALRFQMSGGGAWNAGGSRQDVTQFANQGLLQNIGLDGVFPYGCDDCIRRTPPTTMCPGPNVPPFPATCDAVHICNVQRDAAGAGGTVEIVFTGVL